MQPEASPQRTDSDAILPLIDPAKTIDDNHAGDDGPVVFRIDDYRDTDEARPAA